MRFFSDFSSNIKVSISSSNIDKVSSSSILNFVLTGSLNKFGFLRGIFFGLKRIIKCHPIKFLGGSSGLDLVPKKRNIKNG